MKPVYFLDYHKPRVVARIRPEEGLVFLPEPTYEVRHESFMSLDAVRWRHAFLKARGYVEYLRASIHDDRGTLPLDLETYRMEFVSYCAGCRHACDCHDADRLSMESGMRRGCWESLLEEVEYEST